MSDSLQTLLDTLPQIGEVRWISTRPARGAAMDILAEVDAVAGAGLRGDRYASRNGKRQVTLIQWEHLAVIGGLLGQPAIAPELLRRNIAVAGLNLLALKNKQFVIGDALLEYTGLCHPCSQMETRFGPGGYNAVRGHGGITARILESGVIRVGDKIGVSGNQVITGSRD